VRKRTTPVHKAKLTDADEKRERTRIVFERNSDSPLALPGSALMRATFAHPELAEASPITDTTCVPQPRFGSWRFSAVDGDANLGNSAQARSIAVYRGLRWKMGQD
jgi:hypothetical protein